MKKIKQSKPQKAKKRKVVVEGFVNGDYDFKGFKRQIWEHAYAAIFPTQVWKTYHIDTPLKVRVTVEEL